MIGRPSTLPTGHTVRAAQGTVDTERIPCPGRMSSKLHRRNQNQAQRNTRCEDHVLRYPRRSLPG